VRLRRRKRRRKPSLGLSLLLLQVWGIEWWRRRERQEEKEEGGGGRVETLLEGGDGSGRRGEGQKGEAGRQSGEKELCSSLPSWRGWWGGRSWRGEESLRG
jgi:hypothetical protein